ncbi:MAG: DUF2911 domain-containing protein [Ignavibacteria bacterium]|jgi:tetratricopeptide (TPR) repeat protein
MHYKLYFNLFPTFALILILLASSTIDAQLAVPRQSPAAEVTQTVGITKITINYSRPGVRNREIWGGLVPYGWQKFQFGTGNPAPWRAGANENTIITFSHDVKIEGKPLAAGSYGFFILPEEKEFTLIFSKNYASWGSFYYDEKEDALRVVVTAEEAPFKEWMEFGFDSFTNNSARAYLHWEKKLLPFKIEVDAIDLVIKNFEDQLRGQAGFNWFAWQQAALFCLQNNVHLDKGQYFIEQSINVNTNASNMNLLGYILKAQGKTTEALEVFKENVENYPNNWNVYDSLGEAYKEIGEKDKALESYKKALDKAPQNQKQRIENIISQIQSS